MPRKANRKSKPAAAPPQQAKPRQVHPRLRFWRWPIVTAMLLVLSLLMFGAQMGRMFDSVDDRLRDLLIMPARSRIRKTFDSRAISIILIDQNQNKDAPSGKSDSSHRQYHARLLRALAGKAKIVVFDMEFRTPSQDPQVDIDFAEALKAAENSGTRVLVGTDFDEGDAEPAISPPLKAVLKDHWAIWDGGRIRSTSSVTSIRLGLKAPNQLQDQDEISEQLLTPSLALKAVEQWRFPNQTLLAFFDPIPQIVHLRRDGPQGPIVYSIPVNHECYLTLDLVGKDELGKRNLYQNVYSSLPDVSEFNNKIVVIGYQADDEITVLDSEKRYGAEIQANAISNILQDTFIRELWYGYSFLIILLMIILSVVLKLRLGKLAIYKLPIRLPGGFIDTSVAVPTMLLAVAFAYVVVALVAYLQRTQLGLACPILALTLGYLLVGAVRSRLGFE